MKRLTNRIVSPMCVRSNYENDRRERAHTTASKAIGNRLNLIRRIYNCGIARYRFFFFLLFKH